MTNKEIRDLMAKMPLEEKIAQLYGTQLPSLLENGKLSIELCRKYIPHGAGHLCQFANGVELNTAELRQAIADLQKYNDSVTESKIPMMLHEEAITGIAAKDATITPQMIGMSCSWEPKLVYENARMTAENMKKLDCYYVLSPMVDVITDARWGRGEEGYGVDSLLVTAFSEAFINGLQENGAAATVKHYAGYGVANQELAFFRNEVLPPFEAAVKSGKVKALMPGYHTFHDVPCTASSYLLTDILRKEWGFDGIIVSDYGAIGNLVRHYQYCENDEQAAIAALNAGVDVEFPNGGCFSHLANAVRNHLVSEERIDESVFRVLSLKNELGILDNRANYHPDTEIDLDPPKNRAQALDSAHKAIVLLKNDGVLPLNSDPCKIAVIGPNGDSYYSMLGDYTHMGITEYFYHIKDSRNHPEIVTLLQGLKDRLPKHEIQYERGCDWMNVTDRVSGTPMGDARGQDAEYRPLEDCPPTNWYQAMNLAKESDIILAAVGENRYLCGENCDREDVRLPGEQEKLVEELCATGKPVILIVFGGRPMAIQQIADKCAAVIYAWYPGEEGGHAVADLLTGAVTPSAKLTVTLPDSNDDVPVYYQQGEKAEKCRYPFGFGLSYTIFAYSDLETSNQDDRLELRFRIANTGSVPGAEVAQIYATTEQGAKKLIGFARVELQPQQHKTVHAIFQPESFAEYDANGNLHLQPQKLTLQIGASSVDIRLQSAVELSGDAKLHDRTEFVPKIAVE